MKSLLKTRENLHVSHSRIDTYKTSDVTRVLNVFPGPGYYCPQSALAMRRRMFYRLFKTLKFGMII